MYLTQNVDGGRYMWKSILGYEGFYEVSDEGVVRTVPRRVSCKGGTRMVPSKIRKFDITAGYYDVTLCKEGKTRTFLVHRLVAEAFIPNPENKEMVNHKDGNKQNNNADNLEWVTRAENDLHASLTGLRPDCQKHKPVKCLETSEIFASREAAGRATGMDAASVLISIKTGKPSKGLTFVESSLECLTK